MKKTVEMCSEGNITERVNQLITEGFTLSSNVEGVYTLDKFKGGASGFVHLILFLFTAGLGNLVYWKAKQDQRIILRPVQTFEDVTTF